MEIKTLLHDYIAVKVDPVEEKTASGLYLHEQIKTYPPQGVVTHIAMGVVGVKVGDRVQFKVYASVDIAKDLVVVPQSGLIAVL